MKVLIDRDQLRSMEAELDALREEVTAWRREQVENVTHEEYAVRLALMQALVRPVIGNMRSAPAVARLLTFIMDRPGQLVTHERLVEVVSRTREGDARTVAVIVSVARKALAKFGIEGALINDFGLGYRMPRAQADALRALVAND